MESETNTTVLMWRGILSKDTEENERGVFFLWMSDEQFNMSTGGFGGIAENIACQCKFY